MALRHSLKRFASSTTALSPTSSFAFAPALSVGFGQRAYSTVIEGLKYASSHEWYEEERRGLSFSFFFLVVAFRTPLCLSPFLCVVGFTDDDILSLGCDRNDDDGEKHLLRLTTKALLLLSMMMRLLSLWNAATRLESPRERLLSITPFVKKGEKCPKKKDQQKKTHHFFLKNNHKRQGED